MEAKMNGEDVKDDPLDQSNRMSEIVRVRQCCINPIITQGKYGQTSGLELEDALNPDMNRIASMNEGASLTEELKAARHARINERN